MSFGGTLWQKLSADGSTDWHSIHEAYGMTESASIVTFNHLFRHKIGSIGCPLESSS
jgi:long-subunit acyl-CoA synthetase (AMP-forming)